MRYRSINDSFEESAKDMRQNFQNLPKIRLGGTAPVPPTPVQPAVQPTPVQPPIAPPIAPRPPPVQPVQSKQSYDPVTEQIRKWLFYGLTILIASIATLMIVVSLWNKFF